MYSRMRATLLTLLFVTQLAYGVPGGDGNRGDLVYSSVSLRQTGFRLPYGLHNGLAEAASLWRGRPAAA